MRNVVDDAEPPKRRRPWSDVRAWNAELLQTFLKAAKPDRLGLLARREHGDAARRASRLGVGGRRDVDLVGGGLSISRSLVSVSYELHESRGKTRNSPLPTSTR